VLVFENATTCDSVGISGPSAAQAVAVLRVERQLQITGVNAADERATGSRAGRGEILIAMIELVEARVAAAPKPRWRVRMTRLRRPTTDRTAFE
jgi:hypothetical protein